MDLRLKPRRKLSRITRRLLSSVAETFPSNVFGSGVEGLMLDPSDLTTLFQDTAGTQPVTAAGQTVALALDKSKGLALGPELVTNGDFSSGTTGWVGQGSGTPISVVGGALVVTEDGADGVSARAFQVVTTVVGRTYRLSLDVTAAVGRGQIAVNPVNQNIGGAIYTRGPLGTGSLRTVTAIFTATSTTSYIILDSGTTVAGTVTFDNVSVRELPGNHANQSILASRPLYALHPSSGIRNVANGSADVGNAAYWPNTGVESGVTATKVASGIDTDGLPYVDVRYQGTATNTFNSTAFVGTLSRMAATSGQVWFVSAVARVISGSTSGVTGLRVVATEETAPSTFILNVNGTPTVSSTDAIISTSLTVATGNQVRPQVTLAFTNGATIDITYRIKGLQLEQNSARTAYQFNYANFNIVEAPFAQVPNLLFDGIDDFLVTPTITPGTDKVQVFAGVRKLSDAARGMAVELGAPTATGTFRLEAPSTASPNYFFLSTGTASAGAGPVVTYAAPISNVLSGLSDISGDVATLRVNGTQVAQSTADQGTGNYSAAPIYIGRRGGTTLPFNGRLYGLVVRFGPNLDAATIAATEAWMNTRTGAY